MAFRNFLIAYGERVGSSALVDTLARLPNFRVPIFEDLDWYHIKEQGLLGKWNAQTIHEALDGAFDTDASSQRKCSTGFKWRPWGQATNVASVLADNDVIVFNLVRSDWLEFISSLYMTNVANSDFNSPQFLLNKLEGDDRENMLKRYRENIITVDVSEFLKLCETKFQKESERIKFLKTVTESAVPVYTIFYEDFSYKRFHFLSVVTRILGHAPLASVPSTKFTKVSLAFPSTSFDNRSALLSNDAVCGFMRDWENLLYGDTLAILPM